MKIAVLGGTGKLGRGLAARWAIAGHEVLVGSRSRERGAKAAREISEEVKALGREVELGSGLYEEVSKEAEVVVLSVPFWGLEAALEAIRGVVKDKIVLSPVSPVRVERGRVELLPVEAGSVAELVRERLPGARVSSAFQTVSYAKLSRLEETLEGDVVVCSDDEQAKEVTMELVEAIPSLRALDGGPLANSRYVEGLAYLVIDMAVRLKKPELTVKFI